MSLLETVKIGLRSMRAHPLRSALTLLGLIIGVATLFTVTTILDGANAYVENKIIALGSDAFQVTKTPPLGIGNFDEYFEALRQKDLAMEDAEAIRRGCPDCQDVGAEVTTTARVKYGEHTIADVTIRGVTANMESIGSTRVAEGRYINLWEERSGASVCVLGAEVAERLLPGLDPIGKSVRIHQQPCEVIGVAEKVGSMLGQSQDNFAIIPISRFFKIYGYRNMLQDLTISARAVNGARLERAQDQARLVLRTRRHVAYESKDNFYINTADTLTDLWVDIRGAFFVAFTVIASIASIVGGIVIMNIMLVSVAERTREIGLRRSIGARRRDVLMQFFVEALMLCQLGGWIGIGLGVSATILVSMYTPFPAIMEWKTALQGMATASVIGVVFGLYPARRAALLDPVDALRKE